MTGEILDDVGAMIAAWAREQEAVEETGQNDGAPSRLYAGGRREPWCGHFAATGCRVCGAPLPGDVPPTPTTPNPIALVARMEREAVAAGWWLPPGERARPGDLLLWASRDGSDPGAGRHVSVVINVVGDNYVTKDGNWGNRVAQRVVARSNPKITGIIRPRRQA